MGGNLKEIRKQITSVKNTQKTTKAMKLVSSSKLKKAEELAKRSKVYAKQLSAMFHDVVARIRLRGLDSINSHYFIKSKDREIKKLDIIFITADKGLCGGFNATVIKEVVRLMETYKQQGIKVRLRGIGKKGISFFAFNDIEVLDKAIGLSSMPAFEKAAHFIDNVVNDFLNGVTDEVIIVHNGFKNLKFKLFCQSQLTLMKWRRFLRSMWNQKMEKMKCLMHLQESIFNTICIMLL